VGHDPVAGLQRFDSPSGVAVLAPVAKQSKTCAEVSVKPVEAPPPVKGARSNASF